MTSPLGDNIRYRTAEVAGLDHRLLLAVDRKGTGKLISLREPAASTGTDLHERLERHLTALPADKDVSKLQVAPA